MNLFGNFDSCGGFNTPMLCVGVVDSKSKNQFLDSSSGFSLDKSFLNTFITIIIEISATIVSDIGVAIQTPRAPKISGKSKAAGT